jgi:hypothetical protein
MNLAEISLIGWCGIGLIIFIVFSINVWLFSLLRNRDMVGRSRSSDGDALKQTIEAIRDPFAKENRDLAELSEKVKSLNKPDK